MKKRATLLSVLAIVLFLSFLSKSLGPSSTISYKDFELLDGKNTSFWRKISSEDKQDLAFYKDLYLKHWPQVMKDSLDSKIPKVIHYIWLGPKSFPETSIQYVQSWMQNHPGWVVKFWTDNADRPIPYPGMEKHLLSEISLSSIGQYLDKTDNYGEKSDLLRYEILMSEGGVYVDHDIECFHSFDSLVSSVDFFAGLEPPHRNRGIASRIFPCNAVIGSKASHPVMARSLELVQKRWDEVEKAFPGQDTMSRTLKVLHRTFHSFSLATKEALDKEGNIDVVLPASFFYPDRIVTKKSFDLWKSKGLIWTSHKCAGAWRPTDATDSFYDQLQKVKKEKRHLKKRLHQTKGILYGNLAITALCLFLILKNKQKKRGVRGWKGL